MKYILARSYGGCVFKEKNIFKYPFNSIEEAQDFITRIKDSERFRLEIEWAKDYKIGPVGYTISQIYG